MPVFFCVYLMCLSVIFFFFFNDTATTEIYTLSLHYALPIWSALDESEPDESAERLLRDVAPRFKRASYSARSEEHTSELQSHVNLVCRLLLEKKKKHTKHTARIQKAKSRGLV